MAKENIVYHSLRMNLDNEQHRRVHAALVELNTDIHRSVNQFLIDAADYYIERLNEEGSGAVKGAAKEYISKEDLSGIYTELKDELKNEIIMLLGTALVKGTRTMPWAGVEDKRVGDVSQMNEKEEAESNPLVESLVDGWG